MATRSTKKGALGRPRKPDLDTGNSLVPVVVPDFVGQIRAAWQSTAEGIFRVGQLLMDAKHQLPPGTFIAMVEKELPFGRQTAFMLMKVADHPLLADVKHVQHLPPSWGTLYELTKVPEAKLQKALGDGRINPGMERSEARALRDFATTKRSGRAADFDGVLAALTEQVRLMADGSTPLQRKRIVTTLRYMADSIEKRRDNQ